MLSSLKLNKLFHGLGEQFIINIYNRPQQMLSDPRSGLFIFCIYNCNMNVRNDPLNACTYFFVSRHIKQYIFDYLLFHF